MGRSTIQIYALCVCFFSLMCFVVALGVGLYDGVQMTAPQFFLTQHHDNMYRSNENYLIYRPDLKSMPGPELDRLRVKEFGEAVASQRKAAVQSLVLVTIILLIDSVVFAVHWRIAKRAEPPIETPPQPS
jgi:hypothetical protein